MRRAGLLYCADCAAPRFKILAHRDQLPFSADTGQDDLSENLRKHANYSLDDAFRLRLMLDLVGGEGNEVVHGGLSPNYASNVVWNCGANHINSIDVKGDLWVGVAISHYDLTEDEKANHPSLERRSDFFRCRPFGELGAWIKDLEGKPVRLFLASATRAARFVRERALDLGLPEAENFDVPKVGGDG